MEFKSKILSNGLAIIGEVNKSAQSAAVGFFVKTGARDETDRTNGVSHFIEHMLFKGTEKLSAIQVNEAFDRTGAKFNAFTSEENTVYYAAVLPEYAAEVTMLWIQLLKPALRDEDFDIEKNVIKEEIAMYKDHPSFEVMDKGKSLHFAKHPCGHSVLGNEKSITNLTVEQTRDYFNGRYAANNMVLACAGNLNFQQLCKLAEDNCGNWQGGDVRRALQFYGGSKEKKRYEKANLVREHICLISPAVSAQDKRKFAASLLEMVIGDGTGSRFFWELVDTAIAETAVMHFESMDGIGAFYSYIRCDPEAAAKVMDIVKSIFNNLAKDGITENELQKAKNKLLSAVTIKNELPMGRLVDLGFNWTYLRQYRTIQEDIDAIKAVTVKDLNSLISEFKPGDFTQLSIGPKHAN